MTKYNAEQRRERAQQRERERRTFWYCTHNGTGGGFHVLRPTVCNGKGTHAQCGPRVRPKGE